jgi:hypothetical protein
MLPGIYNTIRRLPSPSLHNLVCEIDEKNEKNKWPSNSQMGYFVEEFKTKYGLSEPEIESMTMEAVAKTAGKRFKVLYQAVLDVKYESSNGVHTRHQCACNRSSARRQCIACIVESVLK